MMAPPGIMLTDVERCDLIASMDVRKAELQRLVLAWANQTSARDPAECVAFVVEWRESIRRLDTLQERIRGMS